MNFQAVIIVCLLSCSIFSQERIEQLTDSLLMAESTLEKSKISLKLGNVLKFSDWKRALTYIEYAEEQIQKSTSVIDQGQIYLIELHT